MTTASFRSLRSRDRQPEVMDEPDLDEGLHRQALRALGRINRISGTARHFWPEIERLAPRLGGRPIQVLDAACGGGDVAIALREIARRRRVSVEVRGCDTSPTALEFARERAARRGVEVSFFRHDVLESPLPHCDAIVCSLFLHHLSEAQAVTFLRALADSARLLVQVSDLDRTRLGYVLARAGCAVLTRSPVVHVDSVRSVAAAFTLDEARTLFERAGLGDGRVLRRFPERYQLVWGRS